MYEVTKRRDHYLAFIWPALAAATASEFSALIAKQFVSLAVGADANSAVPEPTWATPNTIALELKTVRLRDFSITKEGVPALLCAPFALHGAAIVDLAPGHSLVAAVRDAGLKRLFVTDWRSASPDMRFLAIDDYLAELNVLVDQLGGTVDLIGLCQGGWMSLLYAARFPAKIRKLIIAGAPIDIAAGQSGLSVLVNNSPSVVFDELVKLGNGRVLGHTVLKFWGPEVVSSQDIHQILQTPEPLGSSAFAELEAIFRKWYAWTVDLPGTYYLEVIEKLYRQNALAAGEFSGLGQIVDLKNVRAPLYLLAARDDELVAPAQLFALERLVGTPPRARRTQTVPCSHLGLFAGKAILNDCWPGIIRWLVETDVSEIAKARPNFDLNGAASCPVQ